MQLLNTMDRLDTLIEDLEKENIKEISSYINDLRDISEYLLEFYNEHKYILKRRAYDSH